MALKITLVIFIVLLVAIVVVPFVLSIMGIGGFQTGGAGGASVPLIRSGDEGRTWQNASVSEDKEQFPREILSVAFNPINPDLIYLGTRGSGIWRSSNGGASWKKTKDRAGALDPRSDVNKIVVSRANPAVMYAAVFQNGRGRVFKSEDGGESFREAHVVADQRSRIFDMHVDLFDPRRVIIVTEGGGIFETRDGGSSWRVVKWFTESIVRLVIHPENRGEMFIITARGSLFKSVDGGENWVSLAKGLQQAKTRRPGDTGSLPGLEGGLRGGTGAFGGSSADTYAFDPRDPGIIYSGSSAGLFRSRDRGFTWERVDILVAPSGQTIQSVAVSSGNSRVIFAGVGTQVHKSEDWGMTWNIEVLPARGRIQSLIVHPQRPEVIFAVLGR